MRRSVERVSEVEKALTDAYYWLSMYKSGAVPEGLAMEKVKQAIFDQPPLNENQQIVLEYLKKMCPPKLDVSAMVTVYCLVDDNINDNWQEYSEKIPGNIEALQKLTITEENQVLQEFSQWALKQEEE